MAHFCEICGQAASGAAELRIHVASQHEESSVECPFCPLTGVTAEEMALHVSTVHSDSPEKIERVSKQRRVCDIPSSSKGLMTCPICDHVENDPVKLQEHVDLNHADPSDCAPVGSASASISSVDRTCPVCAESGFDSDAALSAHANSHFSTDDSVASSSDFLLAQELDRQERERRRCDEERELRRLRAEFGMDDEGNYDRQAGGALDAAHRRGRISAVDYHERRIDMLRSRASGADDYTSITRDALRPLRGILDPANRYGNNECFLCPDPVDHCAADYGDKGWGCGYRNLQMMLSGLAGQELYRSRLQRSGLLFEPDEGGGQLRVPSIPKLQQLLEAAWQAGFDRAGAEQLGRKVFGTRKWIGATEIAALLRYAGVRARVVDFHRPSGAADTHPALFDWVLDYFRSRAAAGQPAPPLYFQHQGHSRTIVGVEVLRPPNKRLLVFDPSHTRGHMNGRDKLKIVNSLRKPLGVVKKDKYQIVLVCGLLPEGENVDQKVINSERIPRE